MIEQTHEIATPDGPMTTFVVHPERDGPHPVILFFMDAPAIREELRDMARRLATVGYYVMLPNLYHRAGVMEIGDLNDEATRTRMVDLMNGLTIPMVMAGCLGYCMSGQFSINAAARHPERIAAAASLYGTYLVTDREDSPHKVAHQTEAELYFACAETDRWAPLETVRALAQALEPRDAPTEVELYPGTSHGFAFPQRAAYDKAAAERHWERLITLFGRNLG